MGRVPFLLGHCVNLFSCPPLLDFDRLPLRSADDVHLERRRVRRYSAIHDHLCLAPVFRCVEPGGMHGHLRHTARQDPMDSQEGFLVGRLAEAKSLEDGLPHGVPQPRKKGHADPGAVIPQPLGPTDSPRHISVCRALALELHSTCC